MIGNGRLCLVIHLVRKCHEGTANLPHNPVASAAAACAQAASSHRLHLQPIDFLCTGPLRCQTAAVGIWLAP